MADDDSVLRRWSRRKAETRTRRPPVDADAQPDDVLAAVPPASFGALSEAEAPPQDEAAGSDPGGRADRDGADDAAIADLPDIETLDKDSDYRGFMREGVPEKLRNMALRKLWLSDPAFSHIDGMLEYGEDFTDAATVVEGMKSIYEVGKGYITEEDEAKEEEEAAEEEAETAVSEQNTEDDGARGQTGPASGGSEASDRKVAEGEGEPEGETATESKNRADTAAKT